MAAMWKPEGRREAGGPETPPVSRRDDGFSSRRERRLWFVAYAAFFVLLAAGTVRQIMKLWG